MKKLTVPNKVLKIIIQRLFHLSSKHIFHVVAFFYLFLSDFYFCSQTWYWIMKYRCFLRSAKWNKKRIQSKRENIKILIKTLKEKLFEEIKKKQSQSLHVCVCAWMTWSDSIWQKEKTRSQHRHTYRREWSIAYKTIFIY